MLKFQKSKDNFSTVSLLEATMCRASHQSIRWYCGLFDACGIDAKRSTITTDVDLTPEQCRQARLTNKLSINGKEIPIILNVRTTYIKNSGPNIGENPNESDDSGWIIHDTFETYMQDTTFNVNLRGGSVNKWQNIPLQLSEINTIQQICELERSLKNTQLAYSRGHS